MSIDYTSIAINVVLQLLANGAETSKRRRALLKVFKAIADAFPNDPEFRASALSRYAGPKASRQS